MNILEDCPSGIYQVRNVCNGKVYVGSAIRLARRWGEHKKYLNNNKHHSARLQHAWNKYGKESFVFEVLEFVPEAVNLIPREQYWLDLLQSADDRFGYNIQAIAGSQLGYRHTEEAKRKMSLGHKGRPAPNKGKKLSEEAKQKISDFHKGKRWHLGRKHSKEFGLRIAELRRGRKASAETKRKMSETRKGRKYSEEHKQRISESLTGRKFSDETRARLREAWIRRKAREQTASIGVQMELSLGVEF
jgi:group I intron endonuclease